MLPEPSPLLQLPHRSGASSCAPAPIIFVADEPTAGGGADAGPSPFGLLLSGLTACTAMTLRMYAERKGWAITTIEVDARYNLTEDGQASIERTITLAAELPPEQRDRLADVAERTPVTLAVRAGTPITTRLRTTGPASPATFAPR